MAESILVGTGLVSEGASVSSCSFACASASACELNLLEMLLLLSSEMLSCFHLLSALGCVLSWSERNLLEILLLGMY